MSEASGRRDRSRRASQARSTRIDALDQTPLGHADSGQDDPAGFLVRGQAWGGALAFPGWLDVGHNGPNSRRTPAMSAYVIFDVEIRDMSRYQDFMKQVKPALEAAGGRYLARGGAHKVYEGDWAPRRIVVLEFPSAQSFEQFYNGPVYQGLKPIRDACSSARLVCVEGLDA
jgi:uncharacterized protein (DUF1330 family)